MFGADGLRFKARSTSAFASGAPAALFGFDGAEKVSGWNSDAYVGFSVGKPNINHDSITRILKYTRSKQLLSLIKQTEKKTNLMI